ncbi:MAG TPA: ATP-binding protein [Terriglobales bacterium]|nr:ATP-binding protein [Terriglobales bacterium]
MVSSAIGIFLLFVLIFSQAAFNLTFLRPNTTQQTLILVALSALIFLLLVALSFVLLRNLLKLYEERRQGQLGSRFRTRMVVGALGLSFAPVIFLFLFAYGLMNRSIDKWFSLPVQELHQNTGEIAAQVAGYAAENARAEAAALAADPDVQRAFSTGDFSSLAGVFQRYESRLQGGFVLGLKDGELVASIRAPESWPMLRSQLLPRSGEQQPQPLDIAGKEYILGSATAGVGGRIVVAMPVPSGLSATLREMERNQRAYFELAQQRKQVRRTYMGVLLLLTVLVLFAATWFALLLSKQVTRPVVALAEAMQEISRGRLEHRVDVRASDELAQLVSSFNRMAAELQASRQQIDASSRELAEANFALDQRRRHMETILESIPTGVLSLDAERRVSHSNDAFERLFASQTPGAQKQSRSGATLREIFSVEVAADVEHMLRKADRMGATTSQMEIALPRTKLNVAVTAASLQHEGDRQGYVVVFEDLSDVLQAQRQAAWREVARRVAHEIKNPLTPIALSAERIRRHLERGSAPDPQSLKVIDGCAETIAEAVETVRTLVDEFAALARFPASRPQPANINAIVESALAMFSGRLDNVTVRTFLAPGLPPVMADAEAIKRAIANLVDNAAEAMHDSLAREIQVSTALIDSRETVEIAVADTGHGITRELKEKLFLPYFSTKGRGTGLGLAIVYRIAEDHHGTVRVEENRPVGARFILELPLAPAGAAVSHA